MRPAPAARRTSLSGDVVLITGTETPLGHAIARRLAAEVGVLLVAAPDPRSTDATLEDLHRVRALNRLVVPPEVIVGDPETEEGAEAIIRAALQTHESIDAIVHVGDGSRPLDRLLPLVQWGAAGLAQGPGGRLVLGLATERERPCDLPDWAFIEAVRAAASAHGDQGVCVNGVRVEAGQTAAERTLALASGAAVSCPSVALNTAAGLVSLLASSLGSGVSGQVFRVNASPSRDPIEPGVAALFNRKVALR